jgi:hypothetical protein
VKGGLSKEEAELEAQKAMSEAMGETASNVE